MELINLTILHFNCLFILVYLFVLFSRGVIVRIEECSHPIVMKGLCAECGQDLTQ